MIYVVSDVHGYYDCYMDFFDRVNFSEEDELYILGDAIDRGSYGIEIVQDVMKRKNVHMILGNHEYMIVPILESLCGISDESEIADIINEDVAISHIGQEQTLQSFSKLSVDEQYDIIDYIHQLPLYLNIAVKDRKYLLVHAGTPCFSPGMDIMYYTEEELLFGPHDYTACFDDGTVIIIGHTPTCFVRGAEPYEIFMLNNTINIDCGLGFGGKLGVLCLSTMEEIYL